MSPVEASESLPQNKQSLMDKIGSLFRKEPKPTEVLPEDKSAECPDFVENPQEK